VSAIAAKKKRPTASCCQSATRTVRLGGHVQSGTGRVAQKIRGNHSFVNKILTSGLPIGSIRNSSMIWAVWLPADSPGNRGCHLDGGLGRAS
jgi:hypothetical protein